MHIEFTPYMHVERLGTDEVEGILNGKSVKRKPGLVDGVRRTHASGLNVC